MADQPHRVRITVPAADEQVMAWLDAQASASASVRTLIRSRIATHGYADPTCDPVPMFPPARFSPKDRNDLDLDLEQAEPAPLSGIFNAIADRIEATAATTTDAHQNEGENR